MNMISGLEKADGGRDLLRRDPDHEARPGEQERRLRIPELRDLHAHDGVREPRLRPAGQEEGSAGEGGSRSKGALRGGTVGLSAALDRNASRLSVNDMQKVALGRSMIVEPAIFLLDEPFSNLDSAFRAYMRAELKRIQHEIGQTMVYVTHDQVEAMSMADKVAVMDLGVLQQYATPDELYNRPANRFVANFIGSVLNNFVPVTYDAAGRLAAARAPRGAGPIDVSDRKAAIEGRASQGTLSPSRSAPSGSGSSRPTRTRRRSRAKVVLVEPLGAKDIVHMDLDGIDVRTARPTGRTSPDRRQPRARLRSRVQSISSTTTRASPSGSTPWRRSGSTASPNGSGPITALNGVSFDVKDGEFFAILGPPGAGKTTTLRTIVGLERPRRATSTSTTSASPTAGRATATSRSSSRTSRSTPTRPSSTTSRFR